MLFNKIAGAGLLVALVLVAISTIGNALVHPRDSDKGAAVVTAAATPEPAAAAKPAEPPVPIGTLLATADAAAGVKVFKKCKACHTVDKGGKNKIGPNLWEVVNSEAGKRAGFSYSKAMAAEGRDVDIRRSRRLPGQAQGLSAGHQDGLRRPQEGEGPGGGDRLSPLVERFAGAVAAVATVPPPSSGAASRHNPIRRAECPPFARKTISTSPRRSPMPAARRSGDTSARPCRWRTRPTPPR